MMILKSETFFDPNHLTLFVSQNKISRENILTIVRGPSKYDIVEIVLFYYAAE